MTLGDVVGGNGLDADVVGHFLMVAVGHHFAIAQHVGTAPVGDESCAGGCQLTDGCPVEVVAVLMRHKDIVGLWQGSIVGSAVAQFANGVDFYLLAVEHDADAGMQQRVNGNRLAAFSLEDILPGRLGGNRHLLFLPFHDASFQVDHGVARLGQLVGGIGRAASAAAIHGHALALRH